MYAPVSPKVCKFFNSKHGCMFGNKCRYQHCYNDNLLRSHISDLGASRGIQSTKHSYFGSMNGHTNRNTNIVALRYNFEADEPEYMTNDIAINQNEYMSQHGKNTHIHQSSNDRLHVNNGHNNASSCRHRVDMAIKNKCNLNTNEFFSFRNVALNENSTICKFYYNGRCYMGKRCKFQHAPETALTRNHCAGKNEEGLEWKRTNYLSNKQLTCKQYCNIDEVQKSSQHNVANMFNKEVDIIKKRFVKNKCYVLFDEDDIFDCIIDFSPSDPDWPFDVKVFQLKVVVTSEYPKKMMSVTLPLEQAIPETVRRCVEVSVKGWILETASQMEKADHYQLFFCPFIRWLDRNLEDIVTDALKQLKRELAAEASGFQFISAKQLQAQYTGVNEIPQDNCSDVGSAQSAMNSCSIGHADSCSTDGCAIERDIYVDADGGEKVSEIWPGEDSNIDDVQDMMTNPERRGTEISLKDLQLKENVATVYLEKICLTIQCVRCRHTDELVTPGGRINVVQCNHCRQEQVVVFRPAVAHQFSATVGYLDMEACIPFDLILQNTDATICCLRCSADTKPVTLVSGQGQAHWCRMCHCKMVVSTEGVCFIELKPSSVVQVVGKTVKVEARRRLPKDPAIQEGKPLPDFGTCKHYKKSYRWLRFPCCGKCFPCDICHDMKEDHEMKFASRMICGYCCKEQVYSADKTCIECKMTLTRVHTEHWEGGTGCRNKITMCKNDQQKHRNMCKTVSRHSLKVKEMHSGKRTKLRHS